ncbi:MAG: phosphonate metabolism transcriptional regulator PhnF [Acidisphaera sp.]|nr:phosphonate metabolism transcriptional regulator PhnF [Acidisphaera sp.]MBV9812415.1 phosphonate metabolism transcriptional regulator PhnF [Acetobacteraceae bacterium]
MTVAREPGVALWRQIARTVEAEIASGSHLPGGRLPTEAQLSQRFGVNRHTVRRALEELSRSGLVVVEQGRGSFVAEDVLEYAVGTRVRFSETIRAQNREPSGDPLDLRETVADKVVATALGIRAGARVIRFERLGFADERPVALGTHYFPGARFPGLLAALREAPTITAALALVGVRDYRRRVTRIAARLPTAQEAELLRMARNRPVLVTESINGDEAGGTVEFGVTRYPTPRVQIVVES